MLVPRRIKQYMFHNAVGYSTKSHPIAFTAQETAAMEHVPGHKLAKTVLLKADDRLIMAVLPADRTIRLDKLKSAIGCVSLRLAEEKEFTPSFEYCERGAMPPFGRLFGLPLYCDELLAGEPEIEFNAGTHTILMSMKFEDFRRIESPVMLDFSEKSKGQPMSRSA